MTSSVTLHSDHVNYLIFRYLQEHGHADTARSFWRDWHRPHEYRDPEVLPFAPVVDRHDLISVIQRGLLYDELHAQATNGARRFVWSTIDARKPVDAGDLVLNGSRPSSSGKRKSIGTSGYEVQALKRQRMTSVPEVQTNGHMDIDARSSSADDNDEVVSPAVASPVADTPTTRYDSVATQTEVMNGQKIPHARTKPVSTTFEITDKDDVKILHAAWSPSRDPKVSHALFVTGNRLCRMYSIPRRLDASTQSLEHMDEPAVDHETMVHFTSWHPDGKMLTCALDAIHRGNAVPDTSSDRIISIGPEIGGTYTHFPRSELLKPSGIVVSLRYSPSGKYLSIIRTNNTRGSIEIWPAPDRNLESVPRLQPLAWRLFEYHLSDGAWSSEDRIVVCAHSGAISILQLQTDLSSVEQFDASSIAIHNFTEQTLTLPSYEWLGEEDADITYQHEETHDVDLFFVRPYKYSEADSQDKLLVIDAAGADSYEQPVSTIQLDPEYLAAAMQPAKLEHDAAPRLLALLHETGRCKLYELDRQNGAVTCRPLYGEDGYSLRMPSSSATALAWSPNGQHLAIVGEDQLHVWDLSHAARGIDARPVMSWSAKEPLFLKTSNMNDAYDLSSMPWSLAWDALSEKICCTVGNKIVLIDCDLPENVHDAAVVNGVPAA